MTLEDDAIDEALFLLTSAPRNQNGIGTIFIRDILAAAPELNVRWRVVPAFILGPINTKSGLVWRAIKAMIARGGLLHDMRLAAFKAWQLQGQADALEQEFRCSSAKRIWITTSTPELISLALELAQRGIDVRITVWDAPEYLIKNLRLSQRSAKWILASFQELLRLARACSVVSDDMKDSYAAQAPGLPIVLMRHGISPHHSRACKRGPVRIVFAGSLYSKEEWNAFVAALDAANWHISGRDIQLEFVGTFPLTDAKRPQNLVIHPPMSQDLTLDFLTQADIGYLPYWLDPSKEFIARTSFPGKMTAYSAAGLAIFHHGPASSSVTRFLAHYPYGIACDSLGPQAITEKLEILIRTMDEPSFHKARATAMDHELSSEAMMRGFHSLIGDNPAIFMDAK